MIDPEKQREFDATLSDLDRHLVHQDRYRFGLACLQVALVSCLFTAGVLGSDLVLTVAAVALALSCLAALADPYRVRVRQDEGLIRRTLLSHPEALDATRVLSANVADRLFGAGGPPVAQVVSYWERVAATHRGQAC